ncbi:MAG: hypothetical protein JNK72_16055 [Myxococcales bacterium]|nr:hypothetical protein [Myxococcales bacterium]
MPTQPKSPTALSPKDLVALVADCARRVPLAYRDDVQQIVLEKLYRQVRTVQGPLRNYIQRMVSNAWHDLQCRDRFTRRCVGGEEGERLLAMAIAPDDAPADLDLDALIRHALPAESARLVRARYLEGVSTAALVRAMLGRAPRDAAEAKKASNCIDKRLSRAIASLKKAAAGQRR